MAADGTEAMDFLKREGEAEFWAERFGLIHRGCKRNCVNDNPSLDCGFRDGKKPKLEGLISKLAGPVVREGR